MNENHGDKTNIKFNLRSVFAAITILCVVLAVPVIGAALFFGVTGMAVFLGLVIAVQFPIFILIRRWLIGSGGLPKNDNAMATDHEEFRPPTPNAR